MKFDADLNACAALVEKADPDRFRAAMAVPVEARAVLFPLYALNVEVTRAPWVTQEPMLAEMRLQWWRDALQEIAEGGPVRRHEVVTPLARVLSPHLAASLDEFVAVRRWDIYKDPFEDQAHFDHYITCSSGGLMVAAAQALGTADGGIVQDFAYAVGVAGWLRATPELEARGRIPLLDGTPDGVRALAQQALERLKMAQHNRRAVSRPARAALLPGWQAESVLKRAIAHPGAVAAGDLTSGEINKRLSLAWVVITGRW